MKKRWFIILVILILLITAIVILINKNKCYKNSIELNNKIRQEITVPFTDDSSKIIVNLGSDRTAKITPGTQGFGISISAQTFNGTYATKDLKYKITLDDIAHENCYKILGADKLRGFFEQIFDTYIEFDNYESDRGVAIIKINVPEKISPCIQKVFVDVEDGNNKIGRTFFIIDIPDNSMGNLIKTKLLNIVKYFRSLIKCH